MKALQPMIVNWLFEALEISNLFFVKEGKRTLFTFAIILKTLSFYELISFL